MNGDSFGEEQRARSGQSALEIYNSFQYADGEDPDNLDTIIAKYDEHFTGEINETYERFQFNKRVQQADRKMQIDCGSSVNILPRSKIGDKPIAPANITLEMWKDRKKAMGTTKLEVTNPNTQHKYRLKFVVLDEELTPLLSRKAAEKMGLITVNYEQFQSVKSKEGKLNGKAMLQFPDLFNDEIQIGTLPGEVKLTLIEDATSVVCPPKRLPVEVKDQLKQSLRENTTNYQSSRTLHDLAKAKLFSKLDLKHGYWHCVLDEPSSILTTFATPFGRYKWKRLPFGLSVSSEIFQKRLIQALEGLPSTTPVADDILLYGISEQEKDAEKDHDDNLTKLLERCQEKGIRLNKGKAVLKVKQLDFMGHLVTAEGLKPDPNKVEAIVKLQTPTDKQGVERLNEYETAQPKEPLMSHEIPERPWEKLGIDILTFQETDYLVTVDYYSNYWEIDRLENSKSATAIRKLKAHFAKFGIPSRLVSDNGPQFTSDSFRKFTRDWDIEHTPSAPYNSQSNGKAEAAVKAAKKMLCKTQKTREDQYLALLAIRNTPSQGIDRSPIQRIMNRRTRTLLPTTDTLLTPKTVERETEITRIKDQQERQAFYFNRNAYKLTPLQQGDTVRMKPFSLGDRKWQKATVKQRLDDRLYEVENPADTTTFRRNRVHLNKTNATRPQESNQNKEQEPVSTMSNEDNSPHQVDDTVKESGHQQCMGEDEYIPEVDITGLTLEQQELARALLKEESGSIFCKG
ncbi:hypothetical protein QZH41_003511 [Actinostola sp. cb2023]|nr:hypothetical protein QZH41_003511 [Actinostola sp. cb2023]